MKKYLIALIMLIVMLVSCSAPQHVYKHKGFDYKKHNRYQQKMVKKMERVNKRPGKTYFILETFPTNIDKQ